MPHQRAHLQPHIHNGHFRCRIHKRTSLLLAESGHVEAGIEELLQKGFGQATRAAERDCVAEGGELGEDGGVDLVPLGKGIEGGGEPGELF